MLCDAHIHFIPQELSVHTSFYKGVWADKNALYDFLERETIEKALLVYPSTDAVRSLGNMDKVCEIYHKAIEKMVGENPKIIASAIVNIDNLSDISSQLEDLKERGFRLISLASSYKGRFMMDRLMPLFEAAQTHHMPFFIHPQTQDPIGFERVKDPLLMPVLEYSFDLSMFLGLLMMEGILTKLRVKFIFSSLGGVVPFLKERFDRVYMMLRSRGMVKDLGTFPSQILRNVYVDTSGSSLKNIILASELFGEEHLLWGSDYPVHTNIKESLSTLASLNPSLRDKITHTNMRKIFEP